MTKLFKKPILIFLFLLAGCREEYMAKIKSSDVSVLVVEGVLNSSGGPTTVRLTRSFKLDESSSTGIESGAQVSIEGKAGTAIPLYEQGPTGMYVTDQTHLDPGDKYRLHIVTATGTEYASDFAPILKNPEIDTLTWRQDGKGVTVFVSTHNPDNDTRYYRWEYDETWEYHSPFHADWKLVDGTPQRMYLPEQTFTCWHANSSTNLIFGTTNQLSSDVVFEKPLLKIQNGDDRLSVRYSVLVRQYALDKQGYVFYQLMQKNTESLGSIFDAQPTDLTGNVHALSNAAEPVIGYISIAPVREKRLFISRSDVVDWNYNFVCDTVHVPNNPAKIKEYFGSGTILPYSADEPFVTTFYASHPECVDCRIRGGVTEQPSFW